MLDLWEICHKCLCDQLQLDIFQKQISIGIGDARAPPPPKKKFGKMFLDSYHVKFGYFFGQIS